MSEANSIKNTQTQFGTPVSLQRAQLTSPEYQDQNSVVNS